MSQRFSQNRLAKSQLSVGRGRRKVTHAAGKARKEAKIAKRLYLGGS